MTLEEVISRETKKNHLNTYSRVLNALLECKNSARL